MLYNVNGNHNYNPNSHSCTKMYARVSVWFPCRWLWGGFSGWVAWWPPFVTGHCSLAWPPFLFNIFLISLYLKKNCCDKLVVLSICKSHESFEDSCHCVEGLNFTQYLYPSILWAGTAKSKIHCCCRPKHHAHIHIVFLSKCLLKVKKKVKA